MIRSRILGTGRGVPTRVMTNQEMEKLVETSDTWIRERTGIGERRYLEDGRTTSDLATEAGLKACEMAGLKPQEIDCIIVGTVTPDMPVPATAVFVQQKMGVGPCAAFDISAACAGFIYGLAMGDALVKNRQFKRVLVIGVEILSRWSDFTDRNTCVLFGDGAGAVLLAPDDNPGRGILSTHLFADGAAGAEHLNIPAGGTKLGISAETIEKRLHYIKMNGKAVFTHAVKNIAASCVAALQANQMTGSDVDLVVAHQANLRILQGVADRCGLPMDKFFLNIEKYGNTSSASIPIALDECVREGRVKEGMTLLMTALGGGFAWGSAMVKW